MHALDILRREQHAVNSSQWGKCVGLVSDNYRAVCVGLVFESTIPSSTYLCIQFTFYFGLPLTSRRCEPRVLLMTLMRSGIL